MCIDNANCNIKQVIIRMAAVHVFCHNKYKTK